MPPFGAGDAGDGQGDGLGLGGDGFQIGGAAFGWIEQVEVGEGAGGEAVLLIACPLVGMAPT